MGKTKELFFDMRTKEMADIYNRPISKKEAIDTGKAMVKKAMEEGNVLPHELMAQVCRLKEFINAADSELRNHLPQESTAAFGVTFTPVSGGESVDYKDDPVWVEIKASLSHREELLKIARKSTESIYDSEGIEVPRVGTTPRKSSITIKF